MKENTELPLSRASVGVSEMEEGQRMCVCVLACHFLLDSYSAARRADCCEIYNYCGVLCYDSAAASADSSGRRQERETCSVCVQTQRQRRPKTLSARFHIHAAWRASSPPEPGALLPPSVPTIRSHILQPLGLQVVLKKQSSS